MKPPASQPSAVALVDLSELVQTISMQRRSGTMVVQHADQRRRVYFSNGQVIAFTGNRPEALAKAMVWADIVPHDRLRGLLRDLGEGYRELQLIEGAQAAGMISRDAMLDVMDCYIEEGFTEMVGWVGPELQFVATLAADTWASYQAKLGVNVAAGSVLLESLRRQDEIKSLSALIPDPWDIVVRDTTGAVGAAHPELTKDDHTLLAGLKDGRAADDLINENALSPFRATRALAHLRQANLVRLGSPGEIVIQADSFHARGNHRQAYGLYRRAIALGVDSPRIHLHLAELAEALGDHEAAAKSYITAAAQLTDHGSSVVALRSALRLGSDHETPLTQLLAIYRQVGEQDEAVGVLLQLAELYEQRRNPDQAVQAVRQAQELGADLATCATILARIAQAEGDTEQAVLQLELVARAAEEKGRPEAAAEALGKLLELLPGRFDYACQYALVLAGRGEREPAAQVLRKVLAQKQETSEEVLIGVYELLSRLSPGDLPSHEWLAKAYGRRANRAGASEQLLLMATAQEKEGDHVALASTLERMLEVGGEQVDVLKRLALVYSRLGQEGKASSVLCRSVDAALALGQLKEARQLSEVAVEMDPSHLPLRTRLALVANRQGDRGAAQEHYRAAASLAIGMGKHDVAQTMLLQVRKLRPDDLLVRLEIVHLAEEMKDPDLDVLLRDLVHFAVRSNNFGLAVEKARTRVRLVGGLAFEARTELVELLRRMGDNVGELKVGRELLNDLLEQGEFDKAVYLLQRLVASNSRNADLVLQLAEVCMALGDERQSQRFYRHGASLLQLEGRVDEAYRVLDLLEPIGGDQAAIAMARDLLARGQALEWDAIRWSLEQDQRKRIADDIAATTGAHPTLPTTEAAPGAG